MSRKKVALITGITGQDDSYRLAAQSSFASPRALASQPN
jgi:GDP-D-mannose dehydratase